MGKIITLSNLERFHGHMNLSGGSGYIKEIVKNDTSGNIYINTNNSKLYYQVNGTWSSIKLYSRKPRAKNLTLRVSNEVKYAGLVDPSDENASKLRVRVGDTIYAVETSNFTIWDGNASVENGYLKIAPGNYIYNDYPITLGGEDDVEVFVKKYYPDASKQINGGTPYFSMVRVGKLATAARYTTELVMWQELWVTGNAAYDTSGVVTWKRQVSSGSGSGSYSGYNIVQAKDIKLERDYKWIYSATNTRLDFVSEIAGYDTRESETNGRILYGQYPTYMADTLQTVYIAMGDMLNSGYGTMIVTDFHVKINNVTVLSFADLFNQFS